MSTRSLLSFLLLSVLAVFPACGGGGSSSDASADGDAAARIDSAARADAGPADAASDVCQPGTAPANCNFFTGCGCDDGQKCSVNSTSRACASIGAEVAGAACTSDDQCVDGTGCITYPLGGATRACLTYCDDAHACPTTPTVQACYITITGGGMDLAKVCGDTCDMLAQDCPADAQACHPASVASPERGICVTAGTGVQGEACGAGTPGCAEGFGCITPDGGSPICSLLCDRRVAPPAGCADGTECRSLAGHTNTGICLPI